LSCEAEKVKFSVTICNDNFSTEYKWWLPKSYKKNTMTVQSYSKAVPRAQNVNFSISQYYMCEYSSERPGEVITTDLIDGFITNDSRILSVPNKIPNLSNKKPYLVACAQ
jgi:hypothetical protein